MHVVLVVLWHSIAHKSIKTSLFPGFLSSVPPKLYVRQQTCCLADIGRTCAWCLVFMGSASSICGFTFKICISRYCTQTNPNVKNQTISRFFVHCAPETIRSATDTLLCGDWAYMCMVPSVHGERILDLWFHFQNMSGT